MSARWLTQRKEARVSTWEKGLQGKTGPEVYGFLLPTLIWQHLMLI